MTFKDYRLVTLGKHVHVPVPTTMGQKLLMTLKGHPPPAIKHIHTHGIHTHTHTCTHTHTHIYTHTHTHTHTHILVNAVKRGH